MKTPHAFVSLALIAFSNGCAAGDLGGAHASERAASSRVTAAVECDVQADCDAGFCVDGYCCDTRCAGPEEACNVAGKAGLCTAIDLDTDPANCGLRGNVCPATATCVSGDCSCPAPTALCAVGDDDACVDVRSDMKSCGACGKVCTGRNCAFGICHTGQSFVEVVPVNTPGGPRNIVVTYKYYAPSNLTAMDATLCYPGTERYDGPLSVGCLSKKFRGDQTITSAGGVPTFSRSPNYFRYTFDTGWFANFVGPKPVGVTLSAGKSVTP